MLEQCHNCQLYDHVKCAVDHATSACTRPKDWSQCIELPQCLLCGESHTSNVPRPQDGSAHCDPSKGQRETTTTTPYVHSKFPGDQPRSRNPSTASIAVGNPSRQQPYARRSEAVKPHHRRGALSKTIVSAFRATPSHERSPRLRSVSITGPLP